MSLQKDEKVIADVQFEIALFDFFAGLNSSLIIFIRTYRPTVKCRNALDRLRVHNTLSCFLCFV